MDGRKENSNGKENLSIQIEYEKKEGGVVLKKLHGSAVRSCMFLPRLTDCPSLRLPKGHLRQKRRHPCGNRRGEGGEPFLCDGATCRNRGGAGIAKGFPAGYDCGNRGVCLFGLCRTGADTSAGEIDGGFKRMFDGCGRCRKFPCRGRSEASGIMRFTAVNG